MDPQEPRSSTGARGSHREDSHEDRERRERGEEGERMERGELGGSKHLGMKKKIKVNVGKLRIYIIHHHPEVAKINMLGYVSFLNSKEKTLEGKSWN